MQQRYQHHYNLPEIGLRGQQILGAAKVLVVGVGGLGCPAALYLAAAGLGQITLVDDDVVSLSNLQRQILFTEQDVGLKKIHVAQNKLLALNSSIKVDTVDARFNFNNARSLVAQHDFIVDGSDNFSTKYLINDICLLEKKPWVFAAIQGFRGQIAGFFCGARSDAKTASRGVGSLLAPEDSLGPCYRCVYPQEPVLPVGSCQTNGVIGALPGILGSMQALEVVKALVGSLGSLGPASPSNLSEFDFLSMNFKKIKLVADPECLSCGVGADLEKNFAEKVLLSEGAKSGGIHSLSCDSVQNSNFSISSIASVYAKIPQDKWLSLPQAQSLDKTNSIWIDLRTSQEFSEGHYPLAINIPHDQWTAEIYSQLADKNLILYCKSGARCEIVWQKIRADQNQATWTALHKKIFFLQEGFREFLAKDI
ncbi:MAG: ThiF family adenylyltransferase [Pseudobdellovibrionaceae bacterium]